MTLLLMCIKIFFARLLDVSLGTIRTIYTIKGKNFIASLIGIIEVTVWFLVVKEALNTSNSSWWIVISYALGFSIGTYLGGEISSFFSKSKLGVQVITTNRDYDIIKTIREQGYAVSVLDVLGNHGSKYMLFIEIDGSRLNKLQRLIKKLDNKAFIVVNETKYVQNGYFGLEK